jgi:hypothetical protein
MLARYLALTVLVAFPLAMYRTFGVEGVVWCVIILAIIMWPRMPRRRPP